MNLRIGIGYDVHGLKKNRKLFLGGVRIPYTYGLAGHSDADVLLHAIADALLGAAGLQDIGVHFPTTDPAYKNVSSMDILEKVYEILQKDDYRVLNIDSTIVAEKPKLSKYYPEMKKNISQILHTNNVNIKATTNEGLGDIGKGKGMCAWAVCILENIAI